MSIDIASPHGDCHFSTAEWVRVLTLAEAYGWQPAGTELAYIEYPDGTVESGDDWDGNYWTNDLQQVTVADAAALAAALRRALPDIPDHDALEDGPHSRQSLAEQAGRRLVEYINTQKAPDGSIALPDGWSTLTQPDVPIGLL